MNVLERWVEDELTRVPTGPPVAELRRRGRVRRARRVAASFGVVAVAALGMAVTVGSHDTRRVDVVQAEPTTTGGVPSSLPVATAAEVPPLAKITESVTGTVQSNAQPKAVVQQPSSAEIVALTPAEAAALNPSEHGVAPRYLVQVVGRFSCPTCDNESVLQVQFDADGNSVGIGLGREPVLDLRPLGTVYRLPL